MTDAQIDCLVPVDFSLMQKIAELSSVEPLPATVHRALIFAIDNAEHWAAEGA